MNCRLYVCNKKNQWISPLKEKFNNLNIYINLLKWMVYLQTTYELCFWGSVFWIMWFFQRKYKYRCIHVYVRFKDNTHVIWMWIWSILKNITRHQTSYSGSAGWYFRYQSIHIQITYTYWHLGVAQTQKYRAIETVIGIPIHHIC